MRDLPVNQIKNPPKDKPLLLFDGDCNFCRFWVMRWKIQTDPNINYAPYQDKAVEFKEIPMEEFQTSVFLIYPSGETYKGVEAVLKLLTHVPGKRWMYGLYQHVPGYKFVSSFIYRFIARHRKIFSKLTNLIWGNEIRPATFVLSRWVFLRLLGAIYFVAFISLAFQMVGLVGSEGILPLQSFLDAVSERYGMDKHILLPSLFWLNASDVMIQAVCITGAVLSIALFFGWIAPLTLALLWFLYLSLVSAGQVFLSFQWDILLLEIGFLSIFLAPLQIKPGIDREAFPSKVVIFLFTLLLFKLIFSSGVVKVISQDPTWADYTALTYHYETQPLPAWTSWFAHQLSAPIQKVSTVIMFIFELFLPFLLFFPRRIRYVACLSQIFLQILIICTGNYGFFNYLTMALCVLLLDDSFYSIRWQQRLARKRDWSREFPTGEWPKVVMAGLFIFIVSLTAITWPRRLDIHISWPKTIQLMAINVSSFRFVNNYGLFAVMTTDRPEIIIEGSSDGDHYEPYEFKYKPGELSRRPRFVAPHQPRLDWQMWFAALGNVRQNQWFVNFCVRLMQGKEDVLNLIKTNPFPNEPPRYIRANMYNYHFTTFSEKSETGNWWKRDNKRMYLPPISLRN